MPHVPQPRIARTLATLAALAGSMWIAGCVTPLGPGFRIEGQEINVAYVSGAEPAMRVRAAWQVRNAGNQPLDSVDMELPDAESHDLRDIRVELQGTALDLAPRRGRIARIRFDPPLAVGEAREITASYELRGIHSEPAGTDVTEQGFLLPPGDWAPALLRPNRAFARGGEAPKKWDMTVRVPVGWRVHASGTLKGTEHGKELASESVRYRYQQQKNGFLPFAVGGAFQEARAMANGSRVILWTRQAPSGGAAQRAAAVVAAAAQFYDATFGPRRGASRTLWIIECPRKQPCWPVPEAAFAGGEIGRDDAWPAIQVEIEQQLAYTWLNFQVHPDWEAEPLPMGALTDYAAELATVAREGGDARRTMVHGLIASYEFDKSREPEPPVTYARLTDPESARQFAGVKSELFFFALEDVAGQEALLRAVRHLLRAFHGGAWRAADLRSALERESGKNLGPIFRQWLVEPGIPSEFRDRY